MEIGLNRLIMKIHKVIHGHRLQAWVLCAAAFFAFPGCGNDEAPVPKAPQPYRKPEKEWFWRDRLSQRPVDLPPLALDPAEKDRMISLLESGRGQSIESTGPLVEELARFKEPGLSVLSGYLGDDDRVLRWSVVAAIGRIKGEGSLAPLLTALHDAWAPTAILAASCLVERGEPWIIPRLLKALGPYPIDYNPHLMVRVKAACALVRLRNYAGIPFLIKVLKEGTPAEDPDREWDQTPRMAWEKEEALALLRKMTGDDYGYHIDAALSRQAQSALAFETWWRAHRETLWRKDLGPVDPLLDHEIRSLVQGLGSYQARNVDGARYCLTHLGPLVLPYLIEAARNGEFYERFHALEIIILLADLAGEEQGRLAADITVVLKDPAPAVRMKAALALGYLKQSSSVRFLREALLDPDPDVRLAAVESLGRIGGEEARLLLEKELENRKEAQIRVEIKAALVRIDPASRSILIDELLHDDQSRQEWALQKIIDFVDDDGGFQPGAPLEERIQATKRIETLWKAMTPP